MWGREQRVQVTEPLAQPRHLHLAAKQAANTATARGKQKARIWQRILQRRQARNVPEHWGWQWDVKEKEMRAAKKTHVLRPTFPGEMPSHLSRPFVSRQLSIWFTNP